MRRRPAPPDSCRARNAGKNGSTRPGSRSCRSVAKAVKACRGAAQIDDGEKRRGQRIEPEMRAEPGQIRAAGAASARVPRPFTRDPMTVASAIVETMSEIAYTSIVMPARRARATATTAVPSSARMHHSNTPMAMERSFVDLYVCKRGAGCRRAANQRAFSRTPRPPFALTAPSLMSSTPAASRAAISFIKRIHVAADHAVACLHPLYGRKRQPRSFGQRTLVHADDALAPL